MYRRKNLKLKILLFIIILLIIGIFSFLPLTLGTNQENDETPHFYGTVEINLIRGDELNLNSSVFRIFAKDYKDGDLTHEINVVENTVNTSKVGNYHIVYEVQDSDRNKQELIVPVSIKESGTRTVKRKLYEDRDYWNMDMIKASNSHYQDKQNIGLFCKSGANIRIRQVNNKFKNDITGGLFNDDGSTEKNFTISNEWENISVEYDSVPAIQTFDIDLKNTYQLSDNTEIHGVAMSDKIFFANVFTCEENEEINFISVPTYNCDYFKLYINSTDDSVNDVEKYELIKEIHPANNGYIDVKLDSSIKIENKKFVVAIEYYGGHYPTNIGNTSYTYRSFQDLSKLALVTSKSGKDEYDNIPPIICKGIQKNFNNLPIIEIDIDEMYNSNPNIKDLTYYLYGDDQDEFFNNWSNNMDSFALAESDRVSFLIPVTDKDNMINFEPDRTNGDTYVASFNTLDDLFDNYNDLLEMYDSFAGLEDYPENAIDKRIKYKFFITADKSGPGFAFYGKYKTGFSGDSLASFRGRSWAAAHELGHGYDGILTKDTNMNMAEIQNNILAYYFTNKFEDKINNMWLKNKTFSQMEKIMKDIRDDFTDNEKYDDLEKKYSPGAIAETDFYQIKLYSFVNLLNKTGPQRTMAALYKNTRRTIEKGKRFKYADLLAKSCFEVSGYNVVPYLESWHIDVSPSIKRQITREGTKLYYIRDLTKTDAQAQNIANSLNNDLTNSEKDLGITYDGIYSLITLEEFSKYVNVVRLQLDSSELSKSTYRVGETLDITGLIVKAEFSDGSIKEIVNEYDYTPTELNSVGKQEITVSFSGKSESFEIDVVKNEGKIGEIPNLNKVYDGNFVNNPTYYRDESENGDINIMGDGNVTIKYYQGDTELSSNPKNVGNYKIKIILAETSKYTGAVATKNFSITKAIPEYTLPSNIQVKEGKKLRDISSSLPSGFSFEDNIDTILNKLGNNIVKVTYTPNDTNNYQIVTGIELNIKVLQKILEKIELDTNNLVKSDYKVGDNLSLNGLVVNAYYDNDEIIEVTEYDYNPKNLNQSGTQQITVQYENKQKNFSVNVSKINPTYNLPDKIIANPNDTLSDLKLPTGFEFNDSLNTSVGGIGRKIFLATYTPEDITNYNVLNNIEIIVEVVENFEIDFEDSIVVDKKYLKISNNHNINDIIQTNGTVKIYKNNTVINSNEKLATGMDIKVFYNDEEKCSYKLVVKGDINGDGDVDEIDLLKLARYLVKLDNNLNNEYLIASDIFEDNILADEIDLLKLSRSLVGLD